MKKFAFHDFRQADFPLVFEFFIYDDEGKEHIVERAEITEPGVFEVKPLARIYGRPVGSRVISAAGWSQTSEPPDPQ